MPLWKLFGLAAVGLASAVQAQTTAEVRESTDPAKAAAVERAAAELRSRPSQSPVGLVRAKTEDGYSFLSGGITVEDRVAMHAERQGYGLWVATVAKPSGAYLADVELRITRLKPKAVVLERKMDGPWLMIALPDGQYEVTGSRTSSQDPTKTQTLTSRVNVVAKGQRQAVLRFDSTATVDTDAERPFNGNPFGSPAPAK